MESNTDAIIIRRKHYTQLQTHHDKLLAHEKRSQYVRGEDPLCQDFDEVVTRTKRDLAPTQGYERVGTLAYNHQVGRAIFGNPVALNAHIAAEAVNYCTPVNGFAPHAVRPPLHCVSPNLLLGSKFKRNKYCFKCGFQKKLHLDAGEPFGPKYQRNCLREECSKCFERVKDFHQAGAVGPHCTKFASRYSKYNDWFKDGVETSGLI